MKDGKPFINDNWIEIPKEWTDEQRKAHFELASKDPEAAQQNLIDYWKSKGVDVDSMLNKEEELEEESELSLEDELRSNVITVVKPRNSDLLNRETKDLVSKIIEEKDPDKVNDLTNLFELNHRKKNIARIDRLSNILEMIDDEVMMRLSTEAGAIADKDLVAYLNNVQKSMTSTEQTLVNPTPLIQVNNQTNEINISNSGLSQESRKKVLDVVMSILNAPQEEIVEVESEEIEDA